MDLLSILGRWRELLIATLLGTTILFYNLWQNATGKIERVEVIKEVANEQAEKNLEHLQKQLPIVVEQAQKEAWANAKRKYATCNVAGGIRADGLLPNYSGGQDASPSRTIDPIGERLAVDPAFVQACARDAARLDLWIEACKSNPLICEFKE